MRKENTGETIVTIIIIIKYVYEKYIQNDVTAHYGIIYVMKDVNYANIAGTWRLSEWNGEKIDGDTRYYYIKFDRKEKDGKRSYTIYTNLNSATSQQIPGSFTLNKEEDYGDVISGTYYYQLDTDDEWEYSYIVSGLTDISMVWTAKEDMGEIKVYTRCEDIPSDILTGTRTSF